MIPVEQIERRLKAAVDTLRCIPQMGADAEQALALDFTDWPTAIADLAAEFWSLQVGRRANPTSEELAELGVVMKLVGTLPELDQQVVLLRAAGVPWRVVSQRLHVVRPRLWQRWRSATVELAKAAGSRGTAPATTSGQGKGQASAQRTTTSSAGRGGQGGSATKGQADAT